MEACTVAREGRTEGTRSRTGYSSFFASYHNTLAEHDGPPFAKSNTLFWKMLIVLANAMITKETWRYFCTSHFLFPLFNIFIVNYQWICASVA